MTTAGLWQLLFHLPCSLELVLPRGLDHHYYGTTSHCLSMYPREVQSTASLHGGYDTTCPSKGVQSDPILVPWRDIPRYASAQPHPIQSNRRRQTILLSETCEHHFRNQCLIYLTLGLPPLQQTGVETFASGVRVGQKI